LVAAIPPVLSQLRVELSVRHARLHPGQEIVGANLEDPIHQCKIQAYPAASRDRMALQAAPLAEGNEGDAAIVREPQYLRYLVPALRVHHGVGRTGVVVGEDAAPVALDLSPVVANAFGVRQDASQL
jgi:hypothetical protein